VSSVLPVGPALSDLRRSAAKHWPILLGLAVLYVPTWMDLARGLWQTDEHAHGPIILAVAAFLAWRERRSLAAVDAEPRLAAGGLLLAAGLALYVLGRSQEILLFEVGSQIPVFAGVVLLTVGWRGLRVLWFPLLFLVFMIPLPGMLVDALTAPLKQAVSRIAELVLYGAGYPIARAGVVLTIGQYQLLVADACSGLNSMFSLAALGLLYVVLAPSKQWWRNAVLIASILPIAFVANIVRVLALVLITYHFGDEAGQGFLHGFAGIALFLVALTMLISLDGILRLIPDRTARHGLAR
jgi:exosortase B